MTTVLETNDSSTAFSQKSTRQFFSSFVTTQSEVMKVKYSAILNAEPCSEEEFVMEEAIEKNNFCFATRPGFLNHDNKLSSSVSVSSNGYNGSITQRECTDEKTTNTTKHGAKKSRKNCNSLNKVKLARVTSRPSATTKPTSLKQKAEVEHLPRKNRVTAGKSKTVVDTKCETQATASVLDNREALDSAEKNGIKKRKKHVSCNDDINNGSQDYEIGLQRKQKSQQMQRAVRSNRSETCVMQSPNERASSSLEETCATQNSNSFKLDSTPDEPTHSQLKRQMSNYQHLPRHASPSERSKRPSVRLASLSRSSPDHHAKTRRLPRKRKSRAKAVYDQSDNLSIPDQRVLQKQTLSTVNAGVWKPKGQSKGQEAFNHRPNQKRQKASSAKVFEKEQQEEEMYLANTSSMSMDENGDLETDFNSYVTTQSEVMKLKYNTILQAEPCSKEEFDIEEETEENHSCFSTLLSNDNDSNKLFSSNECDDSIIQRECTNKITKQTTNTTRHVPKKSGKICNTVKAKLARVTSRPSATTKPTSLKQKAEVEHLPRKNRVTAGNSKAVVDAKCKTQATASVPDNREGLDSAVLGKKRKKNVSYNNCKNGSQDDETELQTKQKSQQMQRAVRSNTLQTCVTRSTTARASASLKETSATQNLIRNNSFQHSSPRSKPSPCQRKRQVSNCHHLSRHASPSKRSTRLSNRLASSSQSSPDRIPKTQHLQRKRKDTELGGKSHVEVVSDQSDDNSSLPVEGVRQKRAMPTVKAGVRKPRKPKCQSKSQEASNHSRNKKRQKACSGKGFEEKQEEEVYFPRPISTSMDENDDLESEITVSCHGPRHSLKWPDVSAGSSQHQIDTKRKGALSIQGIISPKNQVKKTRKTGFKSQKSIYADQGDNAAEQGTSNRRNEVDLVVNMTDDPDAVSVNPGIGTTVILPGLMDCVRYSEMGLYLGPDQKPMQPTDRLGFSKMFSSPKYSCGLLMLQPLQEKGLHHLICDTMIFCILQGTLHVTIRNTTFKLKFRDMFVIPPDSVYNIKNVTNTEAMLTYMQIK
uniref:centromere protein C-like n=1 Tax=Myxine glutinosa TaxID=7769 RepID=UPI00358FD21A